jgi:hypothetical protein
MHLTLRASDLGVRRTKGTGMVKVELESKSLRKEFPRIRESCCLCKRPTRFWHIHKTRDCALCPDCAVDAKTSDIPTKEEWGKQFDEDEKK